jgi:hypothetical protein
VYAEGPNELSKPLWKLRTDVSFSYFPFHLLLLFVCKSCNETICIKGARNNNTNSCTYFFLSIQNWSHAIGILIAVFFSSFKAANEQHHQIRSNLLDSSPKLTWVK